MPTKRSSCARRQAAALRAGDLVPPARMGRSSQPTASIYVSRPGRRRMIGGLLLRWLVVVLVGHRSAGRCSRVWRQHFPALPPSPSWRLWRVAAGHRCRSPARARGSRAGRNSGPPARSPVRPPRSLDLAMAELDGMIGLAGVKGEIGKLVDVLQAERERARLGHRAVRALPALRVPRQSRHRQDHRRPTDGRNPARPRLSPPRPHGRGRPLHPGRRLCRPHRHPRARDRHRRLGWRAVHR